VNLASFVLYLKVLGFSCILCFNFVECPKVIALVRAYELLFVLKAVDDRGVLTKEGSLLSEFSIDPDFARLVLYAGRYKVFEDVISLVSMISSFSRLFFNRASLSYSNLGRVVPSCEGDHCLLIEIFSLWTAGGCSDSFCKENSLSITTLRQVQLERLQLERIASRSGILRCSEVRRSVGILYLLSEILSHNVAFKLDNGSYRTIMHGV
jgi:HrpA-like RNA helicase